MLRWIASAAALSVTLLAFGGDRQISAQLDRGFRVMTLNAHAGVDSRGRYDLPRLADTIAAIAPNIVGLQEVVKNHAVYNCDDQAALLAQRLRNNTRAPWTHVYVNEWLTKKRECVDGGRGDDVETEGLALLSPEPLIGVEHVQLWNGRIGLAARVASHPEITVIVTHLASGASTLPDRIRQIEKLLPWAAAREGPRILIGDFNAEPSAPELQPILAQYADSWAQAAAAGTAAGIASGSTRPGRESRIDMVLYTPNTGLRVASVEVVDTAAVLGSEVSDHRPVVATFLTDQPAAVTRDGRDRSDDREPR